MREEWKRAEAELASVRSRFEAEADAAAAATTKVNDAVGEAQAAARRAEEAVQALAACRGQMEEMERQAAAREAAVKAMEAEVEAAAEARERQAGVREADAEAAEAQRAAAFDARLADAVAAASAVPQRRAQTLTAMVREQQMEARAPPLPAAEGLLSESAFPCTVPSPSSPRTYTPSFPPSTHRPSLSASPAQQPERSPPRHEDLLPPTPAAVCQPLPSHRVPTPALPPSSLPAATAVGTQLALCSDVQAAGHAGRARSTGRRLHLMARDACRSRVHRAVVSRRGCLRGAAPTAFQAIHGI